MRRSVRHGGRWPVNRCAPKYRDRRAGRHRVRNLALTGVATALAGALVTVSAAAARTPPRTGFESADGARWTGPAEERSLLAAVARHSDRVSVERIGTTKQGRPLRLVRIGSRLSGRPHRAPRVRPAR